MGTLYLYLGKHFKAFGRLTLSVKTGAFFGVMRFFSFLNDFGAYRLWAQLSHSVLLTNSAKFIMFIVVYFRY